MPRKVSVGIVLVATLVLAPAALCDIGRITVSTPWGNMTGLREERADAFLGIPYAEAPVGPLRWRRTVPLATSATAPAPWDATRFRDACPQPSNGLNTLEPVSEDCLFLNVYVPRRDGAAPAAGTYPVMVFVHGGSWNYGAGSFPLYHGTFIASRRDAIVVTINYRLSVLGFIANADLASEDSRGSTGNYGLQDQRAALRWVQANVGSFGGDPNRVMLYGQSAGAGSTSAHLVAPESWPFFQRAVAMSGPWADWTSRPLAAAEDHFSRIAADVGCSPNGGKPDVECMRRLSFETLLKHEENLPGFVVTWTPTVDGVELTDRPENLARAGKFHKIPITFGTVQDEATEFIGHVPRDLNATGYTAYLAGRYGADFGAKIEALYPSSSFQSPWWAVSALWTDSLMVCPARRSTRFAAAAASNGTGPFQYHFVHKPDIASLGKKDLGVFHGADLAFAFEDEFILFPGKERELSIELADYFVNFAGSGDPNVGSPAAGHPHWPAYTTGSDTLLEIGYETKPVSGFEAQRCDMWDEVFAAGCLVVDCRNKQCVYPCPRN